ncbi:hypothetical protein [Nonomuraea sp. NPDC050643]|uniref:hypothetical protein n=1 Tax=Nonomuraea sp. NPDC050643 TaxID=3155660 RepID=UPI0033D54D9C
MGDGVADLGLEPRARLGQRLAERGILDVPDARSRLSTSATRSPREAASSAAPAPVTPPPTTSTS